MINNLILIYRREHQNKDWLLNIIQPIALLATHLSGDLLVNESQTLVGGEPDVGDEPEEGEPPPQYEYDIRPIDHMRQVVVGKVNVVEATEDCELGNKFALP